VNHEEISVLILAAGKGTRMISDLAKVLHPVAGNSMLSYVIETTQKLKPSKTAIVIGHQGDDVKKAFEHLESIDWVRQKQMRGTGDAVASASGNFSGVKGDVLVLYGDIPSIKIETLRRLYMLHRSSKHIMTLLTAELEDPSGYGRIVLKNDGSIEKIVEEKDASPAEKEIQEINTGIGIYDSKFLFSSVKKLKPTNKQKELYLTDLVEIANKDKKAVGRMRIKDPTEVLGINDREAQADVARYIYENHLSALMKAGVSFEDPATIIVEAKVEMGKDVWIEANTGFRGKSWVAKFAQVGSGSQLIESEIGENTKIGKHVVLDHVRVGSGVSIGSGTVIGKRGV
jgi:bifunctional UDP-N-acetylglucosamine pyrophosphorylase/glucosamine-1-phosphate N-acetyltransferase